MYKQYELNFPQIALLDYFPDFLLCLEKIQAYFTDQKLQNWLTQLWPLTVICVKVSSQYYLARLS